MKMMQITPELAEKHYGEHSEKPFFNDLVNFITSGPVVAMEVEGEIMLSSPLENSWGQQTPLMLILEQSEAIWPLSLEENVVHGSDSEESARQGVGPIF